MAKVLITGTSSGIGYQTALVLGRAGHTVYATMRNLERGAALRNAAEQEQLPISIVRMDVDSDESVEAATSSIRAQAGSIDVLVNNAGIERNGSIEGLALTISKPRWRRITSAQSARFEPGCQICDNGRAAASSTSRLSQERSPVHRLHRILPRNSLSKPSAKRWLRK